MMIITGLVLKRKILNQFIILFFKSQINQEL